MNGEKRIFFLMFVVLLGTAAATRPVSARIIHVDALLGSDDNDGREWAHAVRTLDRALELSEAGDEVHLMSRDDAPYTGSWVIPHALTIQGGYVDEGAAWRPLEHPSMVVGSGTGEAVFRTEKELTLDGLDIRGTGTRPGVLSMYSGDLTVRRCAFQNCRGKSGSSGGISLSGGHLDAADSYFINCAASANETGGGIGVRFGTGRIYNCIFTDCDGWGDIALVAADVTVDMCLLVNGAGIYVHSDGTPTGIFNCTIDGCSRGILLMHGNGATEAVNCIVTNCQGVGIDCLPIGSGNPCEETILCNDSWRNNPNWGDILGDLAGVDGNMSGDPNYARGPLGNYYLSQTDAGEEMDSICVDTGHPRPVAGTTRTDHVLDVLDPDMGFHYLAEEALPPTPTPDPSQPTATPNPDDVPQLTVFCSKFAYAAGDEFLLSAEFENPGNPRLADFYLVLDVYGRFFFYPGWTESPDHERRLIETGTETDEILTFIVPTGCGGLGPFYFYGALFVPDTFELIGDYSLCSFKFI